MSHNEYTKYYIFIKVESHCLSPVFVAGGEKYLVVKDSWVMLHVTSLPDLTLCFPLRPLLRMSADYAKGFGGKFGVETDKVDKSAVGFEYQGKTERHESQKGLCHLITSHHMTSHCIM